MSTDFTAKTEAELKGRLKEISAEDFKARFTTEPMTPAKGAAALKRRREAARINTVLSGRAAYDRSVAELKAVEERLAKLGKADPKDPGQRLRLGAARRRKAQLERSSKALAHLKGK